MKKIYKNAKMIFNTFSGRLFIMIFVVFMLFLWIIVTLFKLQIIDHKKYEKMAIEQYTKDSAVKTKRGKIITSDGEVLVYSTEQYVIVLNPEDALKSYSKVEKGEDGTRQKVNKGPKIDKIIEILKESLPNIDGEKIKKEIVQKNEKGLKRYEIDPKINYLVKKEIESKISAEKMSAEISYELQYVRNNLENNGFKKIVGFMSQDNKALYGVEHFYNEELDGKVGKIKYISGNGNFSTIENFKERKVLEEVSEGQNVVLTIDSVLQYKMDEALKKVYEQYNAVSAMGTLIEVETGRVLAMSSYYKSDFVKNIPITDLFEPGSIFKPILIAMGLDSKVINEYSTIYSEGWIKVGDRIMKDHDGSTTGALTLEKLIALSGNVGMVKIGQMISNEKFYNYLTDLGIGSKTGIDTHREFAKKLFSLKDMTEVRKANVSFGQGIATTQIQILMALNAVINNGKLMKPYLVDRFEDNAGNIIKKNEPILVKKVFSDEASRLNRKYMEAVVEKGTGKNAKIEGYRIGGKTGTAQKAGKRGYESGKYFSSFFSFFPVDDPKYAILITVDEPKGQYYGGVVALPEAREVFEKLIKYKGINPQGQIEEKLQEEKIQLVTIKKDIKKAREDFNQGIMPDLTNLSLRELLAIYPKNKYINYEINGSGKVKEQSPLPGVKLNKETKIKIILN